MSTPINVPSVESVQHIYGMVRTADARALYHEYDVLDAKPRIVNNSLKVISTEVGSAATGTGINTVTQLFTCNIVERQIDGTYVDTGNTVEVWNDFPDDVPSGQLLDVVKDSDTPHYKIAVWFCP